MKFDCFISNDLIDYQESIKAMDKRREDILTQKANSLFWLLEHNDVYTAGRSSKSDDLLDKTIAITQTDRGGKYTYHGPGQCIGYIIADLKQFNNGKLDIRKFISYIEKTIINTLLYFGIKSFADRDNIGIWVNHQNQKLKIASIGIKISRMITTHGFSLNVNPNLTKFNAIIPCGISNYGICSMASLGLKVSAQDVKNVLRQSFLNSINY